MDKLRRNCRGEGRHTHKDHETNIKLQVSYKQTFVVFFTSLTMISSALLS